MPGIRRTPGFYVFFVIDLVRQRGHECRTVVMRILESEFGRTPRGPVLGAQLGLRLLRIFVRAESAWRMFLANAFEQFAFVLEIEINRVASTRCDGNATHGDIFKAFLKKSLLAASRISWRRTLFASRRSRTP